MLNLFLGFPSDLRSNAWHVATNSLQVPGYFKRNAVFFFQVPLLKWYYEWENRLLSWIFHFIGALWSILEHRLRAADSVHYLEISWEDLGKSPLCLLMSTMMLHMRPNTYTLLWSFWLLRCFTDCLIPKLYEWPYQASRANYWLCNCLYHPESWLNTLLGANKPNGTEDYGLFQANKNGLCWMAWWKWRNEPTPRTFVLCEYDASTGLLCCHHIEQLIKLSGENVQPRIDFTTSWFGDPGRAMTIRCSEFIWFNRPLLCSPCSFLLLEWHCTTFTFCSLAEVPMT